MRPKTDATDLTAPGLREAVAALEAGFLAVIPTDTVPGLAADPRVQGSKDRLYEAKGRDRSKPIPVLVAGVADAEKRGAVLSDAARKLVRRFWPGPLTVVLPVAGGFEGFRAPDHPLALAVVRAMGGALYATSANRSGNPAPASVAEAARELAPSVKAVLDGGPAPGGVESTVVKVDGDRVEVLREGAISREEIDRCVTNS